MIRRIRSLPVSLRNIRLPNEALACLRELAQLRELDLWKTRIGDSGLRHLRGLTRLNRLDLGHCNISDAGLQAIAGLSELEELDLWKTKISDAGLQRLAGLTQLRLLSLWTTRIHSAGLAHPRGLVAARQSEPGQYLHRRCGPGASRRTGANSKSCFSARPAVGNAGMQHLHGLTQLETLELWGTKVSDHGLQHLAGLNRLRELDLWKTRVTDAGLWQLGRIAATGKPLPRLYQDKRPRTETPPRTAGTANIEPRRLQRG